MLVLAVILVLAAIVLARAQLGAFRAAQRSQKDESDLFAYTRRRLRIRLAGAFVVFAIGVTLAIWDLAEPLTAANAQRLVTLLIGQVVLLFVVAGLDFRETVRTSRF